MIYQLSSEDIVTTICFSPDGLRLYDIRGSYINIWEMNSLIRLYEGEDDVNDDETWDGSMKSISLVASEAWAETPLPITALTVRMQGDLLCIGHGDGSIKIQHVNTSKQVEVEKPKSDLGIEHLTWAEDGVHFAYVELGSQLIVRAMKRERGSVLPPTTSIIMKQSLSNRDGEEHRLLISPEADLVLVHTPSSAQVWCLKTHFICGRYTSPQAETPVRWISHPLKSDCLLSITPIAVISYSWKDLNMLNIWNFQSSAYISSDESDEEHPGIVRSISNLSDSLPAAEVIDQILVSQNKAFILLFISRRGRHRRRWSRLVVLETASLGEGPNSSDDPLRTIPIPSDVAESIERPLAVIGKNRLIFLDKSFWVCSWRIRRPGGQNAVTHHFFLPRDWVNAENLELCQVLEDGTFLCPHKGEVAVIRSDLGSDW